MRIIKNLQNFLYDQEYFIDIFNNCLHVYSYEELLELSPNLIKLKLKKFNLIIKGNNLNISKMDKYELLIKGLLLSLEFER